MGVPAFFRWLSKKYPSIVVHSVEDKPKIVNGVKIPVDISTPNPNGVEFDNLYLDMNGIIHPCCHPEDKPAPKNEDEMMTLIFEYIDRLMNIIRPRKLLYMAIDGVAPRAKMNQQRSRRFRASKETSDKIFEIEVFRNELLSQGADLPPPKPKGEHFDSNCITPGTPFMDKLAKCLHYYIHDRLNNDPGWRNIKVLLSDANVPGEGEHKIMDFIRRQRANPEHDANTRHCLCGADADLIMLGLATHEPNFTIIREEFKPNKPRSCDLCGQIGHEMKDCTGLAKEKEGEFDELNAPIATEPDFIFLRLNILREYLEKELTMHNLPFPFDLERAVDDWVFMCFFVGNDFLPHLPSLEIREGAIDRLIGLYQKTILKTGGYLTDSGKVHLERVQLILTDLGEVEDEIFKNRQENELAFKQRQKDKKKRMKAQRERPLWTPTGQFAPTPIGNRPDAVVNARQEAYQMRMQGMHSEARDLGNHNAAKDLKAGLLGKPPSNQDDASSSKGIKRKWEHSKLESDEEEEPLDDVRLWEDGWKDRYYENKFDVRQDNVKFRQQVAAEYCKGLCWVLKYYYQGCASWTWFFPYHYAPFASDFVNIGDLNIEFDKKTQPFKPLEQLMGVFPAASRQHVPEPWGELMLDPESPIIDFYPENFKIDLNGKKFAWQGVALLPFVDEKRLLKSLAQVYPLLTDAEKKRNVRGDDRLYISKFNSGYDFMMGIYEGEKDLSLEVDVVPKLFDGVAGTVLCAEDAVYANETLKSILPGLPDIHHNKALCARYRDPKFADDFIFPATRLPNAVDPPKVLKPADWDNGGGRSWRPQIGMAPSRQRGYLDNSGHRHLNHTMRQMSGQGQYSNAPPPSGGYGNRYNDRPQRGGYYGQNRNNRDNRYQPYHQRSTSYSQEQQQQQQSYGYPVATYNIRGGYGNRSDNNNQQQQQHYSHQNQSNQQHQSQHKSTGYNYNSRDRNVPPRQQQQSQSQSQSHYYGSNSYYYDNQGNN